MSDEMQTEQPKTKVTKLKIGGQWDWNVSFVQTFQEQTLKTNDQPRDSMTRAIANVVSLALQYVNIPGVTALLNSIAFSSTEKGECFTLTLDVKSRENQYVYLTWGLSKIDRRQIIDDETLEDVEGFEGRNRLNDAVDVLEEEIRKYALGDRLQQQLKIEDTPETADKRQQDLFSSSIDLAQKAGENFRKSIEEMGGSVSVNDQDVINVDFKKEGATVR